MCLPEKAPNYTRATSFVSCIDSVRHRVFDSVANTRIIPATTARTRFRLPHRPAAPHDTALRASVAATLGRSERAGGGSGAASGIAIRVAGRRRRPRVVSAVAGRRVIGRIAINSAALEGCLPERITGVLLAALYVTGGTALGIADIAGRRAVGIGAALVGVIPAATGAEAAIALHRTGGATAGFSNFGRLRMTPHEQDREQQQASPNHVPLPEPAFVDRCVQ